MAPIVALSTKTSGEHHNTKAAGRYFDADAASITDVDEDFCTRGDSGNSDVGGGGVSPPVPACARKQASRPPSRGASHQQSPLPRRRISSGQSIPVVSRPDSSESSRWAQLDSNAAAQRPHSSPLVSLVQHSAGSSGCTSRRHPNGLPARQPSGPLPGMPFLSDLVSRYPVRKATASGSQIALVSGQLYVSGRLREAMSAKKAPAQPSAASPTPGGFPIQDKLINSHTEQSFPPGNYMQQRRAEKEQRAIYTAQQQQASSSRPALAPSDSSEPGPGSAQGSLAAGRLPSAVLAGTSERIGGANSGVGSARQRDMLEGVERWLETNNSNVEQKAGDGRPPTSHDSLNDPSLMYRQYGILRTYGKQSQGLWPSMSLPTASRNGQRVAFERKRTSSGAGGSSPMRPSSQPVVWTLPRQSAW